jgi:hypothetical protein
MLACSSSVSGSHWRPRSRSTPATSSSTWAAASRPTGGTRRGAALALVAGLLYGLSDAATKGFTDAAGHGLLGAVLSPWPAVIVALCAAAFFAFQRGLQLGAAATAIVLMTAAMNVIAVAAGVAVFTESFGARPGIAALHVVAIAAIAAASWHLAAVQARIGERRPGRGHRHAPGARQPGRLEVSAPGGVSAGRIGRAPVVRA